MGCIKLIKGFKVSKRLQFNLEVLDEYICYCYR